MSSHSTRNSLRTPLGVVRGLGAAGHGYHHWWGQRMSSVALVPLSLWFAFSIASMAAGDYASAKAWLSAPCNTAMALLLVVVMFNHVISGVQVIMEDYISTESAKIICLVLMKVIFTFMAATSVVSILKVAFGG